MEKTTLRSRSIEKELFINLTPERVFQALTEKEDLERWFVQKAEVDVCPGGAIRFEWAPGVVERGKILVLDPPHRLSYSWEALAPGPTTVTFALSEENAGTHLHLMHTGIGEGENWDNYYIALSRGWNLHFKNLTIWVETSPSSVSTTECDKGS